MTWNKWLRVSLMVLIYTFLIIVVGLLFWGEFIDIEWDFDLLFPIVITGVLLVILITLFSLALIYIFQRNQKAYQRQLNSIIRGDYIANSKYLDEETNRLIQKLAEQLHDTSITLQNLEKNGIGISNRTEEEIVTEERERIARDLHDSVSQHLFAAMMLLSAIAEQGLEDQVMSQLKLVEKMLHSAQSEMRAMLLHLRPVSLEGNSLKDGLEGLSRELSSKVDLLVTTRLEDLSLAKNIEDNLFRISQELFSNTLRHAQAQELEIDLYQKDQELVLRFQDDGKGFEMDQVKESASYGLKNIRERAASIGGQMKLISYPGQGTKVEIRVPVLAAESQK